MEGSIASLGLLLSPSGVGNGFMMWTDLHLMGGTSAGERINDDDDYESTNRSGRKSLKFDAEVRIEKVGANHDHPCIP
jgi:hypothetical protein